MAQVIDSIPSDYSKVVSCCYVNVSSKIQVARITNVPNWYFERVVFPGQRLMFEAPASALLEVHCGMMASSILSDTIPCDRLRFDDVVAPFGVTNQPESSQDALEALGDHDMSSSSVRELVAVPASIAS
ncbi:MAG: DUF1830 domain-containing protein [Merismopedia sp. SIO2A8]|nr:DUF1830 domain-containing protein [Merismopedia sp. SIO2A8]